MKKVLAALLFAVLALAPLASACDTNYPNGIQGSPIKVNVANCSADNYTPKDAATCISDAPAAFVSYLNANATGGNTYVYESDKNSANLIIYLVGHEVSTDVFTISLKTYGMGRTADGHTLFTAVGTAGEIGESAVSALDVFQSFVEKGWVCN